MLVNDHKKVIITRTQAYQHKHYVMIMRESATQTNQFKPYYFQDTATTFIDTSATHIWWLSLTLIGRDLWLCVFRVVALASRHVDNVAGRRHLSTSMKHNTTLSKNTRMYICIFCGPFRVPCRDADHQRHGVNDSTRKICVSL